MNYQKYRKQKNAKKRKHGLHSLSAKKMHKYFSDLENIFFPESTLLHLYDKVY